jgi:hypothetical protein
VYENPPCLKQYPMKSGPKEEGRGVWRLRGSDSEVLTSVKARESSVSMSTSSISMRGPVEGEEGAESSISTRFRAQGAENAEKTIKMSANWSTKGAIFSSTPSFSISTFYGKVPTVTTVPRLRFGTYVTARKSGLVRIDSDVPWNRYRWLRTLNVSQWHQTRSIHTLA